MNKKNTQIYKVIFIVSILFVSFCSIDEKKSASNDPEVKTEWANWIKNNASKINSLNSEDFSDLAFLDIIAPSKEIIQIGEVAHGIAEQNRLRVRVIKYLHKKHGYNLVAFESGFYECSQMNKQWNKLTAKEIMQNSLYSFWHTNDLLDLFNYIQNTRNGNNPIQLVGFDTQDTGDWHINKPAYLRDIVKLFDPDLSKIIYQTDYELLQVDYNDHVNYVQNNYENLKLQYSELLEKVKENKSFLINIIGKEDYIIAEKTAFCRLYYIKQKNRDSQEIEIGTSNPRDFAMGEMVRFIKTEMFPDSKMVVWAHNFHTYKKAGEIENASYRPVYNSQLMGDILDHYFKEKYYAIGMLGFEGNINYGVVKNISITLDNSIEVILNAAGYDIHFIDLSGQIQIEGNSWMFSRTGQKYLHSRDGTYEIFYIPKIQLDAFFFIKRLSKAYTITR